jgi:hypothetical protein
MPHLPHSAWFDQPNNIWDEYKTCSSS